MFDSTQYTKDKQCASTQMYMHVGKLFPHVHVYKQTTSTVAPPCQLVLSHYLKNFFTLWSQVNVYFGKLSVNDGN